MNKVSDVFAKLKNRKKTNQNISKKYSKISFGDDNDDNDDNVKNVEQDQADQKRSKTFTSNSKEIKINLSDIKKIILAKKQDLAEIVDYLRDGKPLIIRINSDDNEQMTRFSDLLLGISIALNMEFIEADDGLYIIKPQAYFIEYNE